MKKIVIFFPFLLLVASCANNHGSTASPDEADADVSVLTKSIVANDIVIDFAGWKSILEEGISAKTSQEDIAMAKAAVYRFFQHVKLVDGIYVCDITSASEIGLSPDIFDDLIKNLEEINQVIRYNKEKGLPIEVPDVTEEYLNSLLQ